MTQALPSLINEPSGASEIRFVSGRLSALRNTVISAAVTGLRSGPQHARRGVFSDGWLYSLLERFGIRGSQAAPNGIETAAGLVDALPGAQSDAPATLYRIRTLVSQGIPLHGGEQPIYANIAFSPEQRSWFGGLGPHIGNLTSWPADDNGAQVRPACTRSKSTRVLYHRGRRACGRRK
jgi:hypothetical protein